MTNAPKPPHSIDAEKAVLGSVLIKPTVFSELAGMLATDDFFIPAHREIWDAMRECDRRGTLDVLTVMDELRVRGHIQRLEGGEGYMLELSGAVPTAESARHYTELVRERAVRRRLIALATETAMRAAGSAELGELLAETRASIDALEVPADDGPVRVGDALDEAKDAIEARAKNTRAGSVPTGLMSLDGMLGGLRPGQQIVVAANPGGGKCLSPGTLVMRADGSVVPVEHVAVGDLLMGADSKPRKVLGTTRGIGPMFRITPIKGAPWVCNSEHVLTTVHSKTGKVTDIPLTEFIATDKTFQGDSKLFRVAVEFPQRELPVDPYFLGVVLGDGCMVDGSLSVCKPEKAIADECSSQAKKWGLIYWASRSGTTTETHHIVSKRGSGGKHGRSRLYLTLAELGAASPAAAKRIHESYLTAAKWQRLELLAGLMDTDGHMTHSSFDWISASPHLADDVTRLARSVGLSAHVSPCRKGCQTGAVGDYYRVCISGHADMIPTRIPRKKAPPRKQIKDALRTGFTVEPIGDGNYAGFELDGDGRFLLADFTVAHNSSLAWVTAIRAAMAGVPALCFSLEMSRQELIERALTFVGEVPGITNGDVDLAKWDKIHKADRQIRGIPLWVDDRKLSVGRIAAEARRWRSRYARGGLALLVVDYLGLVRSDGRAENRQLEVAAMSRAFKVLAGDLKCPLILVAQLNRQNVTGGVPRMPVLSDLRDSGAIEQDADIVLFPWIQGADTQIIIAKHRNGETGIVKQVRWRGDLMAFFDDHGADFGAVGTERYP